MEVVKFFHDVKKMLKTESSYENHKCHPAGHKMDHTNNEN